MRCPRRSKSFGVRQEPEGQESVVRAGFLSSAHGSSGEDSGGLESCALFLGSVKGTEPVKAFRRDSYGAMDFFGDDFLGLAVSESRRSFVSSSVIAAAAPSADSTDREDPGLIESVPGAAAEILEPLRKAQCCWPVERAGETGLGWTAAAIPDRLRLA